MRLPTHTMCVELGLLACVWQHIPCVLSMHWGFPLPLPGVSCRMVCGSWVCVGGPASGRAGAGVGALVCVCVCACVFLGLCVCLCWWLWVGVLCDFLCLGSAGPLSRGVGLTLFLWVTRLPMTQPQ